MAVLRLFKVSTVANGSTPAQSFYFKHEADARDSIRSTWCGFDGGATIHNNGVVEAGGEYVALLKSVDFDILEGPTHF